MATVYRKTRKGTLEIETRALKLAPRFRNLLILVDGRRSDAELAVLVPSAGARALEALAQGGFVEAIGETAGPSAPTGMPGTSGLDHATFEQWQRDVVQSLLEQAGPMGEALALQMERARDAEELRPLVVTAAQVVAQAKGRSAATLFRQRFGDA
jgi:hypothetical protein